MCLDYSCSGGSAAQNRSCMCEALWLTFHYVFRKRNIHMWQLGYRISVHVWIKFADMHRPITATRDADRGEAGEELTGVPDPVYHRWNVSFSGFISKVGCFSSFSLSPSGPQVLLHFNAINFGVKFVLPKKKQILESNSKWVSGSNSVYFQQNLISAT